MQRQNERHLPPFPIWDDVCTFQGEQWRGIVEVVSGGFPCTDISSAGKGAGINGEKSRLWFEMGRIIREVEPLHIYLENSPRLTHRGLDRVLADLSQMGFAARWGVLGSIHVGGKHWRERIWIVAHSVPWLKSLGRNIPGGWGQQKQIKEYPSREIICKPGFLGKPHGVANRMDRNRAIGDGQDPFVFAEAWRLLNMIPDHK